MKQILTIIFVILIFLASQAYAKQEVAGIAPVSLDFGGKLVNHGSSLFLKDNDFRDLKNFRYYEAGIGTRPGMAAFATGSGTSQVEKIYDFQPETGYYLFATTRNTQGTSHWTIHEGAVSNWPLFSTTGTTSDPVTVAVVRDSIIITDNSGASIWSGDTVFPTALLIQGDTESDTTMFPFSDRFDWIYDNESHTVNAGSTVWMGYSRPFTHIKTNQLNSTWYTEIKSDVTEYFKGGLMRYWAHWTVGTGGTSTFNAPKIYSPVQTIKNSWDGIEWMYAHGAIFQQNNSGASEFQDFSLLVADESKESYMDIGGMASGGTIALGFQYKPRIVRLELPEEYKNNNFSSVSGYYWNGSTIKLMPSFVDNTRSGASATFSQSGDLEFDEITDWVESSYGKSKDKLYWMTLKTSATIDSYVRIYKVSAIPTAKSPYDRHFKGCSQGNGRVLFYNGDNLDEYWISSYNQPDVYVGPDSWDEQDDIRIGKKEKTIAAVPIDNGWIIFKKTDNYYLEFTSPLNSQVTKLNNTRPCIASDSAVPIVVEEATIFGKTRKQSIIYQTADGVYAITTDGLNPRLSDDIKAYFQNGNSKLISSSWIDKSRGSLNRFENEYSLLVGSGSGCTRFNEELIYDIDKSKWTVFDRDPNVRLSAANFIINKVAERHYIGGTYDGKVYSLEDGTTDSGYPIISDFTRKDYMIGVGKSELRGVAFNYEIPDTTSISGCTLYTKPSLSGVSPTFQTPITLSDEGWIFSSLTGGDAERKGFTHKIRMRIPGRAYMAKQHIWAREAEWPQ